MDEKTARGIMSVVPYFRSYFDFKALKRLGLDFDHSAFSFDKLIIWAYIEEFLNGRKTKL